MLKPASMLSAQDVARAARDYAGGFPPVRRAMVTLRPRICPFEDLVLALHSARSVFDIGCGSGFFLYLTAISEPHRRLVGVESSEAVARAAETALASKLAGYAASPRITAAISADEWPQEQFDAVTILDVLHHVPPHAKRTFLHHAALRVAPGGRLLFKDIDAAPTWRRHMNSLHDLIVARERVTYTPRETVAAWLTAAGLRRCTSATQDQLWYRHTIDVFERPVAPA
jgi:2-polyprenyl-3-methyl-5-hydroxy-6-metoxy-1,4-benzoquinol methylase